MYVHMCVRACVYAYEYVWKCMTVLYECRLALEGYTVKKVNFVFTMMVQNCEDIMIYNVIV